MSEEGGRRTSRSCVSAVCGPSLAVARMPAVANCNTSSLRDLFASIVSSAAVQKYGMDYGRNPVGTGPFRFVSWKDNDSIELEANPDYFEPGLPKLAKALQA